MPYTLMLQMALMVILIYLVAFAAKQKETFAENLGDSFTNTLAAMFYADDNLLTLRKVRVDGRPYLVQQKYADRDSAATLLDSIDAVNRRFIAFLNADPEYADNMLTRNLTRRYRSENIFETRPGNGGKYTSYTTDKKSIGYCLRRTDGTVQTNLNLLTFVSVHELTHMALDSVGHGKKFWRAFKYMLTAARKSGVYTPIDYGSVPTNYCGLEIKNNPLYDQ